MSIDRGAVLIINLDENPATPVGHEQARTRPCVVVSATSLPAEQRYPLVVIVPVTGTSVPSTVYPVVQPYSRGLTKPSTVLVDHVRGIDVRRVVGRLAPLPPDDFARVVHALRRVLGLEERP